MHKSNKVVPDSNNFLQIISTIAKPPKSLWYMGELPQQRQPAIVIVGTRKPTPYGREITYKFSYELAKRGVTIISGLAIGVDGIAHQAALDAGGTTIAILPSSLDAIYPYSHRQLAQDIVKNGGLLLTEYQTDTRAFKSNFLARNRIVAGLSDGVLITEAAARSGTISTANFALEQGKPVMAVPGNITSPTSLGCNSLIRKGAVPITELQDILEELGLDNPAQTKLPLAYSKEESIIIELLATGIRDGEDLQKQSGLAPDTFSQTLTMLEIDNKIRALGANQWTTR